MFSFLKMLIVTGEPIKKEKKKRGLGDYFNSLNYSASLNKRIWPVLPLSPPLFFLEILLILVVS